MFSLQKCLNIYSYKISYASFKLVNLYMCEASGFGTVLEHTIRTEVYSLSFNYSSVFFSL